MVKHKYSLFLQNSINIDKDFLIKILEANRIDYKKYIGCGDHCNYCGLGIDHSLRDYSNCDASCDYCGIPDCKNF